MVVGDLETVEKQACLVKPEAHGGLGVGADPLQAAFEPEAGHLRRGQAPPGSLFRLGGEVEGLELRVGANEGWRHVDAGRLGVVADVEVCAALAGGEDPLSADPMVAERHGRQEDENAK